MVVLAMVNMLLLLVGFLSGLRKKSPAANQQVSGESVASQAYIE